MRYDPKKLLEIMMAFNEVTEYDSLLNLVLQKLMELTSSDAGTIYTLKDGKLHFNIIKNNTFGILKIGESEINLPPIVLDENNIENISAYCAIHNETVIIDDVYTDERFNFQGTKKYDEITGYNTRSMLVMPLVSYLNDKTEIHGVIQLLNATHPETGEAVTYGTVRDLDISLTLCQIAANTLAEFGS